MSIGERECVALLSWAAPRLGLDESGFARVRNQVRKRIGRRIGELSLSGAAAYRDFLESDPAEWAVLDELCRVTISRFWRDAEAFDPLVERVIPELVARARARGARRLRVWSMACASGEEPYSLALAWHLRLAGTYPDMSLEVVASDASPHMLARAAAATYPASIFRELPADLRIPLGVPARSDASVTLSPQLRAGVTLAALDVRTAAPPGKFDLLVCRNLVFTYFSASLRSSLVERFHGLLEPHGALMIGKREILPVGARYEPLSPCVFRRI